MYAYYKLNTCFRLLLFKQSDFRLVRLQIEGSSSIKFSAERKITNHVDEIRGKF